jgi:hypothetical protein
MASHPERDVELGNFENATESTVWSSDVDADVDEKISKNPNADARGEPDLDHDEVEQMDEGHQDDLYRQHVRAYLVHISFGY